jgi:HEAT repeat protein
LIAAILTAASLLPLLQEPELPDPARVAQAVAELEQAFKDKDAAGRLAAVQRNAGVLDATVIERIARGLRDADATVLRGSIEALRFMPHPEALKALEAAYRRDRRSLRKDPETLAAMIRGIGQHGDPSSIELLRDDAWSVDDYAVVRARLYSLGHIRSEKSVHALLGEMKSAGEERMQPFMGDFRLALMALTGVDRGQSQDLWLQWWNENKDSLRIAPEEPPLPRRLAQQWAYFWGRPAPDERGPKRGERGND